jgi:phosphoribosylformylglycinamidine cyclo-ligase
MASQTSEPVPTTAPFPAPAPAAAPTKAPKSARVPLTYKEAGVDIEAGDEVVDRIKHILKRTHGPRVIGRHGGFAGMFRLDFNSRLFKRNYRDPVLVGCTDGVGTKVLLAAERRIYDTVGIDCVAMNVNDLIVQGAEPLFFLDYLGLSKLDPAATTAMIEGVAKGCEIAGCALLGGECAEMPDIYKPGDFDIAGFCVGVVELERVVDAARVKKGDIVIGLRSSGVHSNGYTLVRRIIRDARLDLDAVYPDLGPHPLWKVLLEPTRIYAKPIVKLLASYRRKKVISGMAHITGGGLPGNLSRALGSKVDAVLDPSRWQPHPIFPFLQQAGGVTREEMFRVFNMGIGYVLLVRPAFADSVVEKLSKYGEEPVVIGEISKGTGEVRILEPAGNA